VALDWKGSSSNRTSGRFRQVFLIFLLGSLLIGLVEAFVPAELLCIAKRHSAFGILFNMLLVRPQGLQGVALLPEVSQ